MAFVGKPLADGQLAAAKATIYTVPALTTTYLKSIALYSTGAGQVSKVYFNTSGTSRPFRRIELEADESADVLDEPIILSAGDTIEGESTNATTVHYAITGVEEA